jgi:hypothetical protein
VAAKIFTFPLRVATAQAGDEQATSPILGMRGSQTKRARGAGLGVTYSPGNP